MNHNKLITLSRLIDITSGKNSDKLNLIRCTLGSLLIKYNTGNSDPVNHVSPSKSTPRCFQNRKHIQPPQIFIPNQSHNRRTQIPNLISKRSFSSCIIIYNENSKNKYNDIDNDVENDVNENDDFDEDDFNSNQNLEIDEDLIIDTERKYNEICQELTFFDKHSPDTFTPDIITKVYKLFDRLYSNRQYELVYKLLKNVEPNYNVFFKFHQYTKMVYIIDKLGTSTDLYQFCESFRYDKMPNFWRKVEKLKSDENISQLISLYSTVLFNDAEKILNNLLISSAPIGLKIFTFRIASFLYRRFDSKSRIQFYEYLLNLDDSLKCFFSPSLISQLFDSFCFINNDFDKRYQFIEHFVKLNFDANKTEENAFQYKLISSLSPTISPTIKFKLWYNYCYIKNETLNYERDIYSIIYLKNKRLYNLPKSFENDLNLSDEELSKILTILIYVHGRYDTKSHLGQTFFRLKHKLDLPITRIDKIGYLKNLTNTKQYNKSLNFLKFCMSEDPDFESDETLNPILIVLAKNKNWNQLENIYDQRYEKNEVISKDQYITLFIALSVRPGTTEIILKLWENYLKRGFQPNDQVLSAIIKSLINNKSYEEAIQWFSAYSHYDASLTSKSYGLMLESLAGLHQTEDMFDVLDELANGNFRLLKSIFPPLFKHLAILGDYKSIEVVLNTFYPKFNLSIDRDDTRWIMKCHYHANRFGIIVNSYLKEMQDHDISYKDSLLALESANKYRTVSTFDKVWEKTLKIHKLKGDLDIRAYIPYMSNWIRKHGAFGIELKLNEIKQTLKINKFPTILFNQMIFSSLRTQKPWLTKKIVKIALLNNVTPSPKTYSMILQSNVCMPWIARNSIGETIEILKEFLNNREKDKFGTINDDINPISLKLVIKAVIKYKDIYEARELFDMYIASARDNLLNNIHILNIELLILGEEERWLEFDECYTRYLEILQNLISKAKLTNEKLSQRAAESKGFSRLDVSNDVYLRQNYDEVKIVHYKDHSVQIPNWIKKAHFDIWPYRLKQLEIAKRLNEVINIVDDLIGKGVVFSNKNLNETALFLSNRPEYLELTANFIDKFILPYHIKNKHFKLMKIRNATEHIPGVHNKPYYKFNDSVYFEVMDNLSNSLNEKLTPEQQEQLFASISASPNKYILKNLEQIMKERDHIRSSHLRMTKLRTTFYRKARIRKKIQTKKLKRNMKLWKVDESIDYKAKMKQLLKSMDKIVYEIHQATNGDDIDSKRIKSASAKVANLLKEKRYIKNRIQELRSLRKKQLDNIIRSESKVKNGNMKSFKVGRIDFEQL